MLVIPDTNIVYEDRTIVGRLGGAMCNLLSACEHRNAQVLLPLTVNLEFQRLQEARVEHEHRQILNAYKTLSRYGIEYENIDPTLVVKPPDLLTLMRQEGAQVDIAEPLAEDLQDAHRRACLRHAPAQPQTKSDEMRDLVIWAMSLRLAKEQGGALLISNDNVHTHPRGDEEALASGLTRVNSIQRALEFLSVPTGVARVLGAVLQQVWEQLLASNLPLTSAPAIMSASEVVLTQGIAGLSQATARVQLQCTESRLLFASLDARLIGGEVTELHLTDVSVDDDECPPVTVSNHGIDETTLVSDYAERLGALRKTLES